MKNLAVTFVGPVRRPVPERATSVDTSGLHTVADLLRHLGYKDHELAVLHVLSDGSRLKLDAPLDGVESVEILLPVGGG